MMNHKRMFAVSTCILCKNALLDEKGCLLKHKTKVCACCKVTPYCSEKCQKEHWKSHKPHCKNIVWTTLAGQLKRWMKRNKQKIFYMARVAYIGKDHRNELLTLYMDPEFTNKVKNSLSQADFPVADKQVILPKPVVMKFFFQRIDNCYPPIQLPVTKKKGDQPVVVLLDNGATPIAMLIHKFEFDNFDNYFGPKFISQLENDHDKRVRLLESYIKNMN